MEDEMTDYRVTLSDGQTFLMSADMIQASASISANFHYASDGDYAWQSTPYQTADACHDIDRAAGLVAEYFAVDEDDCFEVESVHALGSDEDDAE
jgi:hypothetical protein